LNNEFLDIIKKSVVKFDPEAQVVLYGSRARGDFRDDSDWDVLILLSLTEVDAIKSTIRDELYHAEIAYNQAISSLIYSKKNWDNLIFTPLHKNIDSEGVIL
jgi:predicted nucleotidyltransferase